MFATTVAEIKSVEISISELDINDGKSIKNDIAVLLEYLGKDYSLQTNILVLKTMQTTIQNRRPLIRLYCESNALFYVSKMLLQQNHEAKLLSCDIIRNIILGEPDEGARNTYLEYILSSHTIEHIAGALKIQDDETLIRLLFVLSSISQYASPLQKESRMNDRQLFQALELLLIKTSEKVVPKHKDLVIIVQVLTILALLVESGEEIKNLMVQYGLLNSLFYLLSVNNPITVEYTLAVLINMSDSKVSLKKHLLEFGILETLIQIIDALSFKKHEVCINALKNCLKILVNLSAFQESEFLDPNTAAETIPEMIISTELLLRIQMLLTTKNSEVQLLALKIISNFLKVRGTLEYGNIIFSFDFLKLMKVVHTKILQESQKQLFYASCELEVRKQLLIIIALATQHKDRQKNKDIVIQHGYLPILVHELELLAVYNPQIVEVALFALLNLSSTHSRTIFREINFYREQLQSLFRQITAQGYGGNHQALIREISLGIDL